MENEDLISLPTSSSAGGRENEDLQNSYCELSEVDSANFNSKASYDKMDGDASENNDSVGEGQDSQQLLVSHNDKDFVDNASILEVNEKLTETVAVTEKTNCVSSTAHTENENPFKNHMGDGSPISKEEMNDRAISSVKRPRVAIDEPQPSVHVMYSSLTSNSRQKLEELLQQWSEWHARHCSLSYNSNEVLESGEGTYFPALHVGLGKSSAVSFWIDSQRRNSQGKEFIPLDGKSAPLYDRGYFLNNLEGSLEIADAPRCFNCGSYSHSLRECPKPRDNVAVNTSRKQHKSRRNQNASSRNPTRYYQNSPGGKYDGLRPGALDAETRQLLGLRELDPPPWLNRMREIGYPPGYLDPEDEDQPSGITIFADEENIEQEKEDGEILDTGFAEPPRTMSVKFPGINAPIPENADESRWAAGSSSFNLPESQLYGRYNHSSESFSRGHYHEQRWPRDFRDDGPPGCEPATSPSVSSHSQRYGNYKSSYTSPRGDITIFGRSSSDRGRRSPSRYEDSSFKNQVDDSRNDFTVHSSSHRSRR